MSDKRTQTIGDFRLSTFRRIEKYDSVIDLIFKFWRVNKKALLVYALIALVFFGIGYVAFAGMGWYHNVLVFVYLSALAGISFLLGGLLMLAAVFTKNVIK